MKIVAISDTHGLHGKVQIPDGDVLIHAGDFMNAGYHVAEARSFFEWFAAHPHRHKICIAGNHDRLFERMPSLAGTFVPDTVSYLEDNGIEIDGLRFWGSPYTPRFMNWAFMRDPGEDIAQVWSRIPEKVDVLITHGPPFEVLDEMENPKQRVGCKDLRAAVDQKKPGCHIFGHIHAGYGARWNANGATRSFNVAICNEAYQPINRPTIIDF